MDEKSILDFIDKCVNELQRAPSEQFQKSSLYNKTLTAKLLFRQKNISLSSLNIVHKDNSISEKVRKEGNRHFENGELKAALRSYHMSVRYAIKNSVQLSLAYANCSAACLNLQLYEDCLTNIELAKPNYPKHLQHKLNDRIKKCNESKSLLDTPNAKTSNTRLTYRRNMKIPMLAYCLEFDKKNLANGFRTTRDLEPGDIVAIENPIATCEYGTGVCSFMYCLKICNAEIPCDGCHMVGYCSKICREKAYDLYHKYECAVGFFLDCVGTGYRLSLRVCLIMLEKFKHMSLQDYFHRLMDTSYPDEWDYKNEYDFSMYKYLFFYVNLSQLCIMNLNILAVITALTCEVIIPLLPAEHLRDFPELLILHNENILLAGKCVGHTKYDSFLLENGNVAQEITRETVVLTTCGILSHLNTDFKPNVCLRLAESGKLILEVMRPIEQGEKLLADVTITRNRAY